MAKFMINLVGNSKPDIIDMELNPALSFENNIRERIKHVSEKPMFVEGNYIQSWDNIVSIKPIEEEKLEAEAPIEYIVIIDGEEYSAGFVRKAVKLLMYAIT
jgi:hypothetical protein